jgi:hypothetical protein
MMSMITWSTRISKRKEPSSYSQHPFLLDSQSSVPQQPLQNRSTFYYHLEAHSVIHIDVSSRMLSDKFWKMHFQMEDRIACILWVLLGIGSMGSGRQRREWLVFLAHKDNPISYLLQLQNINVCRNTPLWNRSYYWKHSILTYHQ